MRKSGAGFLMRGLPVDNNGILIATEFLRAVPYFLHERTSGVVLLHIHSDAGKDRFRFQCGSKGGDDDHILRTQFTPIHKRSAIGILNESDASFLQILIDLRVMDHLAEEEDALIRIFIQCTVADFNRILHSITKAKVSGEVKAYRAEVQHGRCKVLLPQIFGSAQLLDATDQGRPVMGGYVEILDTPVIEGAI